MQLADARASIDYILSVFCTKYNLPLTRKGDWRATEQKVGEIQGLPNSRGRIACTNGIDCYIIREDESIFHGHIAHFILEEVENEISAKPRGEKSREKLFDGLFE